MPFFNSTLSSDSQNNPPGIIHMYGGVTAPTGWLLCDGSTVGRNAYPGLFNAVSTLYGSGDGSTTFTLPDMRGRMPVGKGTHSDVSTLGNNDGVAVANRRSKHKHTVTDPGHTHVSYSYGDNQGSAAGHATAFSYPINQYNEATSSQTTGITVGTATDSTDAPAYLVINYIIKT